MTVIAPAATTSFMLHPIFCIFLQSLIDFDHVVAVLVFVRQLTVRKPLLHELTQPYSTNAEPLRFWLITLNEILHTLRNFLNNATILRHMGRKKTNPRDAELVDDENCQSREHSEQDTCKHIDRIMHTY